MFSATPQYYDLIYSAFKDYDAETRKVAELIRALHPNARTILDVACGTAEHARRLAADYGFDVDGLDLDPAFVEIARTKLPSGNVYQADMTSFVLPKQYDVVLCLFSSIGYARTLDNVRRALGCFRQCLNPGGVMVVEPWFRPDTFFPGRPYMNTAEAGDLKICRMSQSAVAGNVSKLFFEYLIATPRGLERASEVHELGLFTVAEMQQCFADAGLSAQYDADGISGRGLYVARVA